MELGAEADEHAGAVFERLKAIIYADAGLPAALAPLPTVEALAEALAGLAAAHGLDLPREAVTSRLRPDPLGLSRFAPPSPLRPLKAASGWLPVAVIATGAGPLVDWAWFGERPLAEAFYEESIRHAINLPFNRLFRFHTPLDQLPDWTAGLELMEPDGFIFHLSRCGSTLAAQMLAASSANVVVSEAAPIDVAAQIARADPGRGVPLLRAMVRAFGQRRDPRARRLFIKLDSWHTLALPQFRQAFPRTPFVFMYRQPVEVMVSQMRQRGTQMVPEYLPPAFYGLTLEAAPDEDYCARVLAAVCAGVLAAPANEVLLVDYAEMPGALFSRILPHFAARPDDGEARAMAAAAAFDAKAAGGAFTPDSQAKRKAASPAVLAAAARRLDATHARLEARREAQIVARKD